MFNFNINWLKIIKENVPYMLQTERRISWIKALIAPFVQIYQEFLFWYQVYVYKIRFNGQIIYLEKILNDKFSPTLGGIYIIDGGITTPNYLYRQSELKPPNYMYRKWNTTIPYLIGQFSVESNKVYKALTNNTSVLPSANPLTWEYHDEVKYLRRNVEFLIEFNFIVRVPSGLVFNMISMRAIIDYYRLAGKRYKIEIY